MAVRFLSEEVFISRWLWLDGLSVKQTRKRTGLSFFYNDRLWTRERRMETELSRSRICDIGATFLETKTKIVYKRCKTRSAVIYFSLHPFSRVQHLSSILHSRNRNKAIIRLVTRPISKTLKESVKESFYLAVKIIRRGDTIDRIIRITRFVVQSRNLRLNGMGMSEREKERDVERRQWNGNDHTLTYTYVYVCYFATQEK